MLNEIDHIQPCIEGVQDQTCPSHWITEILVVDGGSIDGSRELVAKLAEADPRIRLVDNSRILAAAAANIGIQNATADLLCFISAHGAADPDYVEKSVAALVETGATGVGGSYRHEGLSPSSMSIGLAMASPFGMASPHRISDRRQIVDTISHPVFRRQALIDVGGYNEDLHRNEDYELNYRLRKNGGTLVFTPEISTVYRPRRSLRELGVQFFAYGEGKAAFLFLHPEALQIRHVAPPAAVALGGALTIGTIWSQAARIVLTAGASIYGIGILAAAAKAKPRSHDGRLGVFILALPVMHVAWGSGVLVTGLRRLSGRRRNG